VKSEERKKKKSPRKKSPKKNKKEKFDASPFCPICRSAD
jgi:hypothetical protein